MALLGTAPEIAFDRVYPFEHSYLTYLTRLVGQIGAPRAPAMDLVDLLYGDAARVGRLPFEPVSLDRVAFASDSLHAVWQAFSVAMRAGADPRPRLYAEKYWGALAPVAAAGLNPIVVDLIRDPRDVIASVRAFNARTGAQRFGRAAARDDDEHLHRLARGMSVRLAEFARPVAGPRLRLRYEDLVSDLPGQAARLGQVLGVRLDPAALSDSATRLRDHRTSPSPAASVQRWRADLTAAEVQRIERALGPRLTALGYPPSTSPPS